MTTKIAELSTEQKARLPEFVEKWTRIGLCTDAANRPAAAAGVRLSYRNAGIDPPEKIVWCGSPLSMVLARSVLEGMIEYQTLVQSSVTDSVRSSVKKLVKKLVRNAVLLSIRSSVADSVGNSVSMLIWSSVQDSVAVSVLHRVSDSLVLPVSRLVDPVGDSVRTAIAFSNVDSELCRFFCDLVSGQYSASWCAYNDYFRVVCGLTEHTHQALGLMRVAENADWWMPFKDICLISERPNLLIRDDGGRLHCEDGPALSYPDGWSIYAIHGVLLDEQVIMHPRTQSVKKIRNEPNAEVKRVRIERFGWGEYLKAVGATVLDVRDNDVEATREALMQIPDGQVVLVCSCPSTARVYSLEVPPDILTCEAAQDWLSGGLSRRVINGA